MNIGDFCGQDTGGQSYRLAEAIRKNTDHVSHSFRLSRDYLDFPVEYQYGSITPEQRAFISDYLSTVDIVHVRNRFKLPLRWGKINPAAKWVYNQHGRHGNREVRAAILNEERLRGAYRVVSTINLLEYVDGDPSRWLPSPVDLAMFDRLKSEHYRPDGVVRIAHSPTRRDYKATDLLIEVVAELQRQYPVELVLIEGKPWRECLALKARCDITFDQIHLQHGNSGLEGMAFGQPTLVGLPNSTLSVIRNVVGFQPFLVVSATTLRDELINLLESVSYRSTWGDRGRTYVERFHSYPVVAKKAVGIYERVLGL